MKELTYEEWRALSPEKAAEYISKRVFLTPEHKKKLLQVLKREWSKTWIHSIEDEGLPIGYTKTPPSKQKRKRARRNRNRIEPAGGGSLIR